MIEYIWNIIVIFLFPISEGTYSMCLKSFEEKYFAKVLDRSYHPGLGPPYGCKSLVIIITFIQNLKILILFIKKR